MRNTISFLLLLIAYGCSETAKLPVAAVTGPNPTLVEPKPQLIPTFQIAPAKGWPPGTTPVVASGFAVNALATGLDHPRWLYVLPNGDVLVAETNGPERPDDRKGIKGWFMKKMSKKAGGAVPSANRITLLRDADGDGVAEMRSVFLQGLTSPFGMALVGNDFYVADTDALLRFPYAEGKIAGAGWKVAEPPARLPKWPPCRRERSTITGPRTSSRAVTGAGSMCPSDRTATRHRTEST